MGTRNVPHEVAHHRARVAGLVRRGADPAQVDAARRQLQAERDRAELDKHIAAVTACAGLMTPDQVAIIRHVFRYGPADADAG